MIDTEFSLAKAPETTPEKGKTPDSSDVFLREVDDAVRRGDMESFLKTYGWWLLGGIILLIAAWGGYILYQNNQAKANGVTAENYVKALDAANSPNPAQQAVALKTFETIGKDGSVGYQASAQMMQAGILAKQGKTKEAVAIYTKVSANTAFPKAFRDMAIIRQTIIEHSTLKPADVIKRLAPMAKKGEPFFGTAGELSGLAMLKAGQKKEAGALFKSLAEDKDVAPTIRSRATLLASQLGIDIDLKKTVEAEEKAKKSAK
jgi:hypothetical protein